MSIQFEKITLLVVNPRIIEIKNIRHTATYGIITGIFGIVVAIFIAYWFFG